MAEGPKTFEGRCRLSFPELMVVVTMVQDVTRRVNQYVYAHQIKAGISFKLLFL